MSKRKTSQTSKHTLLKPGDVICLVEGMRIHAPIREKYISAQSCFNEELNYHTITIGKKLRAHIPTNQELAEMVYSKINGALPFVTLQDVEKFIVSLTPTDNKGKNLEFDTSCFAGYYTVIEAKFDGAGNGHGPKDTYPNGWHVFCTKNGDGTKVDFYQTGFFDAMIKPEMIEPVLVAK